MTHADIKLIADTVVMLAVVGMIGWIATTWIRHYYGGDE